MWPWTIFGRACFPIWNLSLEQFLDGSVEFDHNVDLWTNFDILSRKARPINNKIMTQHPIQYEMARDELNSEIVYIISQRKVVGAYGDRFLYIEKSHRGKKLSTPLIIARATLIQGPPSEGRRVTKDGRAALTRAYNWIVQKHRLNQVRGTER